MKSNKPVPIITPENKLLSDFETHVSGPKTEKILGILLDSELNFESHISKIIGKLIVSCKVLRALKPIVPFSMMPMIAKNLINSSLYFSCEIYAMASTSQLRRIQLAVHAVGRTALKRKPNEHRSNFEIYQKLGIFPIKVICAIQTIFFWRRQLTTPAHPLIRDALENSFATSRRTCFKARNDQPRPIRTLIDAYEFYKAHCRATSRPIVEFRKISKKELDGAFEFVKGSEYK